MAEIVLLLSLWPFHHKKASKTDAYWEAYFEAQRQRISDADCAKQDGLWFYAGDDNMIGFSPASCDAAKHNWSILHIDPVRTSRVSVDQDIERFPMCDPKHPEVKQCVRPLKPYKHHRWPFLRRRNPFDPKRMSRS